ncbi:MAG: putative DNA binding domain-containing protein [Bacteroides sp.]|nr:putative DNA binding domain-containing protein [Bacteroides sp.]
MTSEQIKELCALGESSKVQFKQTFDNQRKVAAEMIAFANYRGGVILFGIKDKTGEILGLSYEEVQRIGREVGNTANEQIRPTLYLQTETIDVDGKFVLAVNVEEGINKPYKDLEGQIWMKQGSDKRRITENAEILKLFHESANYLPDEEAVYGSSTSHLDMRLLDRYLMKVYGKHLEDFGISSNRLLQNLRLLTSGDTLTLAGLLFFGKNPQDFRPSFMIKAVSFYGNDMGGTAYRDSKDLYGTIPELFEQGMSFLKSNLHSLQVGQSFNSTGKLEISEIALEEILQNALVHRQYIKTAPIRIMIFDNRVEITSPGHLPDGMSVEELKFGNTFQRNPLIAALCAKTMHYRGLGTGILRAIKEGAELDFVNNESGDFFSVIIHRPSTMMKEKSVPITGNGDMFSFIRERCLTLPMEETEHAVRLLEFCKEAKGLLEMMELIHYTNRTSFRRRLLNHLLEAKLLLPEIQDKPNSPKQRYKSTFG